MSKIPSGGTDMWCPKCEVITTCKAVPTKEVDYFVESGQRWFNRDHTDVRWFRRGRLCLKCGNRFLTAEATEVLIDELIELRDALAQVKSNTEEYVKRSDSAAKTLKKLNESLSGLRALKIYTKLPNKP
ncbi:MAG TPA: hypothetical protein VJU77_06520 [Chthoniobacterales bacterium]|nr:hypothetical protein [Chthoniobacterales bacterium]